MPAGDPLAYLEPPVDAPVEEAIVEEAPVAIEEEVVAIEDPASMAGAIIARTPGTPEELLSILAENGWELVQVAAPVEEAIVEEPLGAVEETALPTSGSPTNNLADLRRMAAANAIRGGGVV